MTTINLEVLAAAIGVPGEKLIDSRVVATPWSGSEPAARMDGAETLVVPDGVIVDFVNGIPTTPFVLQANDGAWCWRITVIVSRKLNPPSPQWRWTGYFTVLDVPVADFGDLIPVDPTTFVATPFALTAWQSLAVGPTGPAGPPGPSGVIEYATMEELNAIRQGEVGVLNVADTKAAFTGFASAAVLAAMDTGTGQSGPSAMLITSSIVDEQWPVGTQVDRRVLVQSTYFDSNDGNGIRILARSILFNDTGITYLGQWVFLIALEAPPAGSDWFVPMSYGSASYGIMRAKSTAAGNSVAIRNSGGNFEVNAPSTALEVVNKSYADALGTAAATASTVVRRDASGRTKVAAPAAADDAASKSYVDAMKITYATMAELDAIRTAQVGVFTVPNMKAAFTGISSAAVVTSMGEGPGSLVITSVVVDEHDWDAGVDTGLRILTQTTFFDSEDFLGVRVLSRKIMFSETDPTVVTNWEFVSLLTPGGSGQTQVPYWNNGVWGLRRVSSSNAASELIIRDSSGRAQVSDPVALNDIATRGYVERAGWRPAPATATSTGIPGEKAYDASFLYICVAGNTWRRVALSAW